MPILSVVLALVPLLGVAYILLQGSIDTVDNLFTILILLAMSAVFGGNAAYELLRARKGGTATGKLQFARSGQGTQTERGLVESVMFFESPIGQPDKSLVALRPPGSREVRMIPFEGDLRNQFPVGQKVEVTYRSENGANRVLAMQYK